MSQDKQGLLYISDSQTLICSSQGTTIIYTGLLDYFCNKMLYKLLQEGFVEQISEEPVPTFKFNEDDEIIIQRYLGSKNELFNTTFIAAMT